MVLFLNSSYLFADDCAVIMSTFEKEEKAYDSVNEIAVASNVAYDIVGRFIKSSQELMKKCPKSISLDRQYTLKRKLKMAKANQSNYRVMTQEQLKQYARTHPEHIVVYKWGTIKVVR